MGKPARTLALILALVLSAIYWTATHPPKLGLDLRGGAELTLQAFPDPGRNISKITPKILDAAKFVVEKRINGLGVTESSVQAVGEDRLLVQLPGVSDPAQAERVLGNTAQLEFRKQKQGSEGQLLAEQQVLRGLAIKRIELEGSNDKAAIAENDAAIERSRKAIRDLFERTGLTGEMLADAVPSRSSPNATAWEVALTFNEEGGKLFAQTTGELGGTGRSLGIFLDDELISAPTVGPEFQGKGITGGRAVIQGNFSLEEASELALQLRAGALPVPVKLVENRTVGATLGADSVRRSIYAGLAGLFLVLVFMVVYYRVPGVVADVALVVYAIFTLALFSLLGVTLTLAGIAGFILSIGIAVDANVLIFERTREELRAGKTIYKSIEAGFNRAWSSILDSNVTTLITSAALFWLGSGSIRGFAVTLSVGIAVSMFTAITCSRALLLALITNPDFRRPELYGVVPVKGLNGSDRGEIIDNPAGTSL